MTATKPAMKLSLVILKIIFAVRDRWTRRRPRRRALGSRSRFWDFAQANSRAGHRRESRHARDASDDPGFCAVTIQELEFIITPSGRTNFLNSSFRAVTSLSC